MTGGFGAGVGCIDCGGDELRETADGGSDHELNSTTNETNGVERHDRATNTDDVGCDAHSERINDSRHGEKVSTFVSKLNFSLEYHN